MSRSRKKPARKKPAGRKEKETPQSDEEGYSGSVHQFIGKTTMGKATPGDDPEEQKGPVHQLEGPTLIDETPLEGILHQFASLVITPSVPKGRSLAAWKESVRAEFYRYCDEYGKGPSNKQIFPLLEALEGDPESCIGEVDTEEESIWYKQGAGPQLKVKFKTIKDFLTILRKEARD